MEGFLGSQEAGASSSSSGGPSSEPVKKIKPKNYMEYDQWDEYDAVCVFFSCLHTYLWMCVVIVFFWCVHVQTQVCACISPFVPHVDSCHDDKHEPFVEV